MNINQKIYNIISMREISFLYEIDLKLKVNKNGPYKYFKSLIPEMEDVGNFINNLEENKIYVLIPFISINDKTIDPFMVLSQQILLTKNNDPTLLSGYLDSKIKDAVDLFNIKSLDRYFWIFKIQDYIIYSFIIWIIIFYYLFIKKIKNWTILNIKSIL